MPPTHRGGSDTGGRPWCGGCRRAGGPRARAARRRRGRGGSSRPPWPRPRCGSATRSSPRSHPGGEAGTGLSAPALRPLPRSDRPAGLITPRRGTPVKPGRVDFWRRVWQIRGVNRKLIPLLAGLILAPYALGAQAPNPPPHPAPSPSPSPEAGTPSFPSQVELVTVDLVVTDKKGVPIPDLKATDFTVSEDGDPQTIASFEAVQLPATPSATPKAPPRVSTNTEPESRTGRTFVILFDTIHLAPPQAQRAKIAVAEFLKNGVREGDRVTLIGTGGEVWWSTRMEAGRDALMAMLKRLDGRYIPDMAPDRMSDYEAMRIHVYHDTQVEQRVSRRFEQYGASTRGGQSQNDTGSAAMMGGDPMVQGKATEVYFQSVSRNRITLQILERTLTSLASTKGRKSLILVSEG